VVELDGDQHGEDRNVRYDDARTHWLIANNFRVLRCTNSEFLRDPQSVLDAIWHAVQESGAPLPEPLHGSTLPQGEGGLKRRLHRRNKFRFDPPLEGGSVRRSASRVGGSGRGHATAWSASVYGPPPRESPGPVSAGAAGPP
jgi:hypothetical protein